MYFVSFLFSGGVLKKKITMNPTQLLRCRACSEPGGTR